MTDVAASPLRVGLIGLGRPGLHLVERFADDSSFRVVAVAADPIVAEVVSPCRGPNPYCRLIWRMS